MKYYESRRIKDRSGKTIGYHTTDLLGNEVIKDTHGKTVARPRKDLFGNQVYDDADGHFLAGESVDMLGRPVLRNGSGRVIAHIPKNSGGHDTYGDGYGGYGSGYDAYGGGYDAYGGYGAPTGSAGIPIPYTPIYVSPEEKKLDKVRNHLFWATLASYVLLTGYVVLTFFVDTLPKSYVLMLASLSVAMFASHFLSRLGDSSLELAGEIFLFFLQSLIYMFQVTIVFSNLFVGLTQKQTLILMCVGPGFFLASIVVGRLLGVILQKKMDRKILNPSK